MKQNIDTAGERIKRSRESLRMSQKTLGAFAGISGSAISQIESGDSKQLRPSNLFKIAEALGKSAKWIATGEGPEAPNGVLRDIISDLPEDSGQQALDFIQYRIEKAEGFIASEKLAHYTTMIESFKQDLAARTVRKAKPPK